MNDKYICPRCGEEVKIDSRYCMKCGHINYNHPDNQGLAKYQGNLQDGITYQNGKFVKREFEGVQVEKDASVSFGSKTGNKSLCCIINILLFFGLLLSLFFYEFVRLGSLSNVLYSNFPYVVMALVTIFGYLYAYELVYMKMNLRWWTMFIPIYNILAISNRVFGSYLYGLISFIPIIGQIYLIVLIYKLGQKMGYNGVITVLFFPIVVLFMGYSTASFDKVTYVNGIDSKAMELEYKLRKSYLVTSLILFFGSMGLLIYLNISLFLDPINGYGKYYYVYAARNIVNKAEFDFKYGDVNCDTGIFIPYEGEYYFYYPNAANQVNLLFSGSREPIEAYVRVKIDDKGKQIYYISLTDGSFGIEEMEIKKIGVNDVVELKNIKDISELNTCHINY